MNRFTPRAGQVLALSRREAEFFHHDYVGSEHLLLGLVHLGQGVAVDILKSFGLDLVTTRNEVEKQTGKGHATMPAIKIPFTAPVKNTIALAGKEAKALGHDFVGTEHIFLGLLRDNSGVAARVLRERGVDIEKARAEVANAVEIPAKPRWGLRRQVLKSQRLPIVILSSVVCVLLLVVAWHEYVLHPF